MRPSPTAVLTLLAAGACTGPTDLALDVRVVPLSTEFVGTASGATVPFTIVNSSPRTVYLAACDSEATVVVEKAETGRWEAHQGLCLTVVSMAPIELAPGETVAGHVAIGSPGQFRLRAVFSASPSETPSPGAASPTFSVLSPPPPFRIVPEQVTLTVGSAIRFQALGSSGEPVPAVWYVDDPRVGTIGSDGLFTSNRCAPLILTLIRAVPATNPNRSAVAQVHLIDQLVAFVSVVSMSQVADGAPVQLDSLAGPTDVRVNVLAEPATCRSVTALRLEVIGSGGTVPVDSVGFDPPLTAPHAALFRWNTAAFPNGSYGVRAVARKADGGMATSNAVPVQVRNP